LINLASFRRHHAAYPKFMLALSRQNIRRHLGSQKFLQAIILLDRIKDPTVNDHGGVWGQHCARLEFSTLCKIAKEAIYNPICEARFK
jgi:hypothetical protein